jgi:hypothetical protein
MRTYTFPVPFISATWSSFEHRLLCCVCVLLCRHWVSGAVSQYSWLMCVVWLISDIWGSVIRSGYVGSVAERCSIVMAEFAVVCCVADMRYL